MITDLAELAPIEADWRRLAELRGNAFVTPEWLHAWFRHYGDGVRPFVVVSRLSDGSVQGLVPFVLSRGRGRGSVSFAGANLGDHFHPVAAAADEEALARAAAVALAERRREWSMVVLHNVDEDAAWPAAFVRESPLRLASVRGRSDVLPRIDLQGDTWASYMASRSRNFRGQLNRKRNRLEREHDVVFRKTEDVATLAADMSTFFALHDLRWSGRGGSSVSTERARRFLTDFAEAALGAGWLRLWFLDLGGETAAAWLGWRIGDRYVYYLAGFDPRWSKESVGLVLLAHTIRDAAESRSSEYDMLLGDEEYKWRFSTGQRTVGTLVVTPSFHPLRLVAGLEAGLRGAGRRLPAGLRDPLRETADRVLRRLPSARER